MDPRSARMKRDKIACPIDEVHGAHETCFCFPLAVFSRPEYLEELTIAEEIRCISLPEAKIDLELVMSKAIVFCKDHDHIFKRHLSSRQSICRRDQRSRAIRQIGPTQIGP